MNFSFLNSEGDDISGGGSLSGGITWKYVSTIFEGLFDKLSHPSRQQLGRFG